MRHLKYTLAALSIMYSISVFSCNIQTGKAYPSITTENGIIVFDETSLKKEAGNTSTDEEIGIDVNFFNCSDGTKTLIGELPFLANTGKIKAAFFAKAGQNDAQSLFVIHSVEIRSDTGVRYGSDYYGVHVYKKTKNGYIADKKTSSYFGFGGDILDQNYNNLTYVYPYKTELSITKKLATASYKNWLTGTLPPLTINKKTTIYEGPVIDDNSHMYLIKGDKVKQEAIEAGWLSITFKTSKDKEVRGWIKCEDANGC